MSPAGPDLTLAEVNEALELIREGTDGEDANIIFGTVVDPRLAGAVRITVLATGFSAASGTKRRVDPLFSSSPRPEPTFPAPETTEKETERQATRVPTTDTLDIPAFLRRRS